MSTQALSPVLNRAIKRNENDNGPSVAVTYAGMDLNTFQVLRLHIRYRPFPLAIDAAVSGTDQTLMLFDFESRFPGRLALDALVDDDTIIVAMDTPGDFEALPDSGELQVGDEHYLYTAKSGSTGLVLATPLTKAYPTTQRFERLPDLRAGTYDTIVETVDASSFRLSFDGLSLKIARRTPEAEELLP